jgi:hypothetical protein
MSLLSLCLLGIAAASPSRILFIGASQKSHLLHAQGLAEEMADRGYNVSFAALESDRHCVSSEKVAFVSTGEPPHDAAFFHFTHDITDLFALCAEYSEHLYDSLLPRLQKDPPGLLVFDHLFWPAGRALSQQLGVPGVMLLPGLAGLELLGEEPDFVPMVISGVPAPVAGFLQRAKNFLMLRVARHVLQRVRTSSVSSFLARVGLGSSCPYGKTELALHGSLPGLAEFPRIQLSLASPLFRSTGPWLPRQSSSPLAEPVLQFLEGTARPVVFVAIGSNAEMSALIAESIVGALLQQARDTPDESRRFRVLWSIKPACETKVLTPALTKLGAVSTNDLMLVPFVDQFLVLQHPNVKTFVSHCGFGSFQEALFTGTPLLAMPMMLDSDQVTNGVRAVQLGVALSFDCRPGFDECNSATLLRKMSVLVGDSPVGDTLRANAARLSAHSKLMKGPARGADWLQVALEAGTAHMLPLDSQVGWVQLHSLDLYACFLLVFVLLAALVRNCMLKKGKDKVE